MAIRIGKDRSAALFSTTWLLLAVLALSSVPRGSVAEATGGTEEAATEVPTTCFIIRTYWGHGDTWGDKSLRRILSSLRNQTVDKLGAGGGWRVEGESVPVLAGSAGACDRPGTCTCTGIYGGVLVPAQEAFMAASSAQDRQDRRGPCVTLAVGPRGLGS